MSHFAEAGSVLYSEERGRENQPRNYRKDGAAKAKAKATRATITKESMNLENKEKEREKEREGIIQ